MWKERAEKAEAELKTVQAELQEVRRLLNEYRNGGGDAPPNGGETDVVRGSYERIAMSRDKTVPVDPAMIQALHYDLDRIYQEMKIRAQSDPGVLVLLAQRPELRVQIEPKVLEIDGASLQGGIALLIHRGFFGTQRNGNAVFKELQRIGRKAATRTVYDQLERVAEWGFLTKEADGYLATDLKVTVKK